MTSLMRYSFVVCVIFASAATSCCYRCEIQKRLKIHVTAPAGSSLWLCNHMVERLRIVRAKGFMLELLPARARSETSRRGDRHGGDTYLAARS